LIWAMLLSGERLAIDDWRLGAAGLSISALEV
jgi:hypothetical protein